MGRARRNSGQQSFGRRPRRKGRRSSGLSDDYLRQRGAPRGDRQRGRDAGLCPAQHGRRRDLAEGLRRGHQQRHDHGLRLRWPVRPRLRRQCLCSGAYAFGTGTIRANGGSATGTRGGGGGRVALIVTAPGADFGAVALANVSAYGGTGAAGNGGAGTVYLQTGSQSAGRGSVTIDNNNQPAAQTEIPPRTNAVPNELERAALSVVNRAAAASTANATIGQLLIYTNCFWTLTNWTLSVGSPEHSLEDMAKRGPGATNRVDHYSQILWIGAPPATVLMIF